MHVCQVFTKDIEICSKGSWPDEVDMSKIGEVFMIYCVPFESLRNAVSRKHMVGRAHKECVFNASKCCDNTLCARSSTWPDRLILSLSLSPYCFSYGDKIRCKKIRVFPNLTMLGVRQLTCVGWIYW